MVVQVIDLKEIAFASASNETGKVILEVWLSGNVDSITFKGSVAVSLIQAIRDRQAEIEDPAQDKILFILRDE